MCILYMCIHILYRELIYMRSYTQLCVYAVTVYHTGTLHIALDSEAHPLMS